MIFNVMDFGAAGDGKTDDTHAVQAALDKCSECGGGTVLIPGGHTFRTGHIIIHSFTELHLEQGSMIKASDRLDDFLPEGGHLELAHSDVPSYVNCDYNGGPGMFFVHSFDSEYVAITGEGRINGNEEIFYGEVNKWHIEGSFYPRVPLLFMENVKHLRIRNVTLEDSAFWTTHLVGCDDVVIDGVSIYNNLRMANCDGIDPDHCRNLSITNCRIISADDCIVFKNTAANEKYGPCENITVSNCSLTSTSAALKFGTESEALFRNIIVSNCNITASNRGIALMLRDKGSIENVIFSNINIDTRLFSTDYYWGKAEPFYVTALRRSENTKIGHIRNVTFENINCCGENGYVIYGEKDAEGCNTVSGIRLKNITVDIRRKTGWPQGYLDLRPGVFSEQIMGELRYETVEGAGDVTREGITFLREGKRIAE